MSFDAEERAAELRDLFFLSAQELLQALNEQALLLEKAPGDVEITREIRRSVHTLKGDAAACGLLEMSELAHELEDVLAPETAARASGVAEVVLSAADMFDAMLTAYRAKLQPPSGDPLRAMIWKLAKKDAVAKRQGELEPKFSWSEYEQLTIAEAAGRGLRVYNIAIGFAPDCPMRAAGVELLRRVLQEAGTVLASAPESEKWAEFEKLEFALATERNEAWLLGKCRIPGVVSRVVVEPISKLLGVHDAEAAGRTVGPRETSLPRDGASRTGQDAGHERGAHDPTVRVEAARIDNVLNLVGELVIAKSLLHEAVNQFAQRFPKDPLRVKFADAMGFQSQVLSQLQRSTMKMRMVPVEQLFRRFPRLVRDVAKVCGKDVTLVMSGDETDLDKGLLDGLAEPLAHLVRNAVDHGIEFAAERKAAGKPAQGTIRLHASHEGNQVVIEVSDDGRGIDSAKVLASAVAKGVVSAETAGTLSPREALELIFEPGFSTAARVTEVSGRGIGMDVVKATVQRLKGTIGIETKAGTGTKFVLRLPLTLAIIRAMLFRVGERMYAASLESVREITRVSSGEIHTVDKREVLQLRDGILPLVRLNRLVTPEEAPARDRLFVVVVENGERRFGLLVDKLVGEEELVIKPLDEDVVASELVSGAAVLGDGAVALILNVNEVARRFTKMVSPALEARA